MLFTTRLSIHIHILLLNLIFIRFRLLANANIPTMWKAFFKFIKRMSNDLSEVPLLLLLLLLLVITISLRTYNPDSYYYIRACLLACCGCCKDRNTWDVAVENGNNN